MQPLEIGEVMHLAAAQKLGDGTTSPVRKVIRAYVSLKDRSKLLAAEKRLLFECCLLLEAHNFSQLSAPARETRERLESRNKAFKFRPPKKKAKAAK